MPTQEFEAKVLAAIDQMRAESELAAKGMGVSAIDQFLAATQDADRHTRHVASQPGMSQFPATYEWALRVIARASTVLGASVEACPHWDDVYNSGYQPGFMFLTQKFVSCVPCVRLYSVLHTPPLGEDDRCDWCGDRGVKMFTSHVCRVGPMTVVGDACDVCTEQLRVLES